MCLRPFGLYCNACLGILFVSSPSVHNEIKLINLVSRIGKFLQTIEPTATFPVLPYKYVYFQLRTAAL
jgi:hypothetical protein